MVKTDSGKAEFKEETLYTGAVANPGDVDVVAEVVVDAAPEFERPAHDDVVAALKAKDVEVGDYEGAVIDAVREFQHSIGFSGMRALGIVDEDTWNALTSED